MDVHEARHTSRMTRPDPIQVDGQSRILDGVARRNHRDRPYAPEIPESRWRPTSA
jgi:hypothetical protein